MYSLPVPLDVLALLLALLLDVALGEPPNRLHPTVWIGNTVAIAERAGPGEDAASGLATGVRRRDGAADSGGVGCAGVGADAGIAGSAPTWPTC